RRPTGAAIANATTACARWACTSCGSPGSTSSTRPTTWRRTSMRPSPRCWPPPRDNLRAFDWAEASRSPEGRVGRTASGLHRGHDGVVGRRLAGPGASRQRRLDRRAEPLELLLLPLVLALVELRHDLAREQLEALADVLVLVVAGLADEDH